MSVALRAGPVSLLVRPRAVGVGATLVVVLVVVTGLALSLGSYVVPADQLLAVLTGGGSGAARRVVLEWRAPRAVAAAVFGAALGLSGAVFQGLTRNPLGSPDVVGFSVGSFTGVLLVTLAGGVGFTVTAAGALVGGLATALVVYVIAFRRGVQGFRLIITGIAVSSMLTSVNTWVTVKAELDIALRAAVWGAGTLNGMRWDQAAPGIVAAGVVALLLVPAAPALRQLGLGDGSAAGLGLRVERAKLELIVLGVALTAVVTAVAGPIGFVALAAPQVARRMTGGGPVGLVTTALVGAALLAVSDVVALHALGGAVVPVGAVTVCVGGLYLIWLLARDVR